MAKRRNVRGSQLVRGFVLGQLYELGQAITTARIRKLGLSRATAKRDMKALRTVIAVTPSKPFACARHHIQQRAVKKAA